MDDDPEPLAKVPRRTRSRGPMGFMQAGHVSPLGAYVVYSHLLASVSVSVVLLAIFVRLPQRSLEALSVI